MPHRNQGFSAVEIILVIVMLGLAGMLGWVYFDRMSGEDMKTSGINSSDKKDEKTSKPVCKDTDNKATDGVFCSEEIGVKFSVPTFFNGKITVVTPQSDVEKGFSAKLSGTDNWTLTITKEMLRDGDVGVGHQLQNTSFDITTKTLKLRDNSASVPSQTIDGITFFRGAVGDVGTQVITYLAVVNNKIVKIQLTNQGYIGNPESDPTTIDVIKTFEEFDKNIKSLEVV